MWTLAQEVTLHVLSLFLPLNLLPVLPVGWTQWEVTRQGIGVMSSVRPLGHRAGQRIERGQEWGERKSHRQTLLKQAARKSAQVSSLPGQPVQVRSGLLPTWF